VNERAPRTTVSVVIAGEEYKLRSDATPAYTMECAALVDRTLAEILQQSPLVEGHKAAILAALSITDQLLQARAEHERLRAEIARQAAKLVARIEAATAAEGLAAGS
jgi:cell division protein ZapA (FtsZ GTPase activity inhibitor)